jgi:hypothetical protein
MDPLLFENPEVTKKVREIQIQALKRVAAGAPPNEALRYFVKKSGLFQIIERSLGV